MQVVLRTPRGEWWASETGFGFLLRSPEGFAVGVYPSLEEASRAAEALEEAHLEDLRRFRDGFVSLEELWEAELTEGGPGAVQGPEEEDFDDLFPGGPYRK